MNLELVPEVAQQLYLGWYHVAKDALEDAANDPECKSLLMEQSIGACLEGLDDQMNAEFMEELAGLLTKLFDNAWCNIWHITFMDVAWSFGAVRRFIVRVKVTRRACVLRYNKKNAS